MQPKNQLLLGILVIALAFQYQNAGSNPDRPNPNPDEPASKRMVLVCAETEPKPKYTLNQDIALGRVQNGDLRTWIDTNCAKDGFRCFDPDETLDAQTEFWRKAFDPTEATPPWVKTYNGRRWSKAKTFANADELKAAIGAK